jgi:4-hydroxybenzoate polyprenyltransferase
MAQLKPLIKLMRPVQWIKNGFVFMPLVFSARLLVTEDVLRVAAVFAAFCLASSATYILNDYKDMEQDKAHPLKKRRPLASGDATPGSALGLMFVLAGLSLVIIVASGAHFLCLLTVAGYLLLQVLYCFKLKNVVILDVLVLSSGFLLRVLAGAAAIGVAVSSWLILCTFSVAILLALGKRRNEVLILGDRASLHRPVLEHYSVSLLDQLLQMVTTSTFIFYCLYSVKGNPTLGLASEKLMFTIPLVTYGIFRYVWLIYHRRDGGSPTALLLTDLPLLTCTIIWLLACIVIIYS